MNNESDPHISNIGTSTSVNGQIFKDLGKRAFGSQ